MGPTSSGARGLVAVPVWRGDERLLPPQTHPMPESAAHLERLAKVIVSSDSLDELVPELAASFGDAVGADLVVIWVREGDQLVTRAAVGFGSGPEPQRALPIALIEQHATDAGPIALDPALGIDTPLVAAAISAAPVATMHAVPLRRSRAVEGLVVLGWRDAIAVDDERRTLLTALAGQVGPALFRFRGTAERDMALATAERALAMRDEILGVVAHDLRNPLNVISTAAELMKGRTADPAQHRHLERILRSVQRADRLVRDLLDVNAVEGTPMLLDRRRVEVVEVVLAAIESQQVLAAGSSVVLGTDLSPALPTIEVDELRIQEVLETLIASAIKYNQRGDRVVVGASFDHGELRLWVTDRGADISPETLPHVFDRFWQGVKRDRRGSGLGLVICRAIVDAHGGRIWAESQPGVGTTMSFTLPVETAPAPEIEKPPAAILLVDHRAENLDELKAILAGPHYRFVTAASGEDALREALRQDFLVALIDVAMPGMDGFECASHLKKLRRHRDVPILIVTDVGEDADVVHRAYAAGGADCLARPFDGEVVRRKVAVFVELAQRLRTSSITGAR